VKVGTVCNKEEQGWGYFFLDQAGESDLIFNCRSNWKKDTPFYSILAAKISFKYNFFLKN